jgi:hypothetical protein
VLRTDADNQRNCTRSRLGSHVLCSGRATLVPMVESTDLRDGDDPASVGRLHRTSFRAVFPPVPVCAAAMVIVNESPEVPVKTALSKYDDVIHTLAANGADDSFDIRTVRWGARLRKQLSDAHRLHLIDEVLADDAVPVSQQIARRTLPWECFAHLFSRPLRRRMRRDREMHNASPIVCPHQKYVKTLKPNRRHGEEIVRYNAVDVIR